MVFYLFNWNTLKRRSICWALCVPAVVLCALFGRSGDQYLLYTLNMVGIPLLLMTHAVFASSEIPLQSEGAAVGLCIKGFFVKPFTAIPDFLRAFASLFARKGQSRLKKALLGLAIGLPVAAVVLALLVSADEMMRRLMGNAFANANVWQDVLRALNVLLAAALFYSFLYRMIFDAHTLVPAKEKRGAEQTAALVVLALLLAVYAVFAYVQFRYLFGGRLPDDLTYSEYARQGFSQILIVAVINFSVYTCVNALCKEGGALRIMQTLLLCATALLLASALMRLLLYIGAYGLTMRRILPLWLMIWLCALTVMGFVRLYREKMPMLRIAALSLVYWFVALNLVDWSKAIDLLNLRYF